MKAINPSTRNTAIISASRTSDCPRLTVWGPGGRGRLSAAKAAGAVASRRQKKTAGRVNARGIDEPFWLARQDAVIIL
jgi:hypothetical protein